MAIVWSSEQIVALAPDAGSVKNGKALATASKWQNLGGTERVLWGECQGSGKNPYQAQIDLSEPAFKCSCPSRKFPCKHGLGLFLLHTSHTNLFTQAAPPTWVQDRIDKRSQTAQKKEEKQKAPVDEVAQAKRQQKRSDKVGAGIADLDLWLQDLMSAGLAEAQAQSYSFWDGMAARLVDAQAPGLARRVRQLAGVANSGAADWASQLLIDLSQIHLIIQGYQRQESLSPELAAEIRTQIGWTTSQDDLLGLLQREEITSHQDDWLVMGKSLSLDPTSNLQTQRIWLRGQNSDRDALILNFAVRNQPLDVSWLPGSLVPAGAIFFPSSYPLRAIAIERQDARQPATIAGDATIELAIDRYRQGLIQNPWLEAFPLFMQDVIPSYYDGNWSIVDRDNNYLPLQITDLVGWQILASSGGHPLTLMGEWNGHKLRPLGIWHDRNFWQANTGEVW
ncbi:SWIM zinc finger family protein [Chamaesiphon sp. VAR_48_metabat_403]|uniref:SWIM zinc finger family protein n=1 Tax=Chamaesiphon sp. VAR_48_metabat_403 TaxID=2964700 RepID=UPI00286D9F72|nr:SWIM zinc finger family protein [Chamaesiphon sp. VAR_48_metabat_403]